MEIANCAFKKKLSNCLTIELEQIIMQRVNKFKQITIQREKIIASSGPCSKYLNI